MEMLEVLHRVAPIAPVAAAVELEETVAIRELSRRVVEQRTAQV
jgi:hypothetical protein